MYGNRIKSERIALGLDQAEFGKKLGKGQGTVSTWETEARQPSIPDLIKMSGIFGCSVDYLLGQSAERVRR